CWCLLDRLLLLRQKLDLELLDNRMRDLVLNGEDISEIAIESFGPNVCPVFTVNELSSHTDARAGLAHAAFENEIRTELLAGTLHFHGLAFVGERCVTRDDRERRDLREISDDVFSNAVVEIFLLGIAAH